MSLVISLRVPDGIVTAADSLATAQNILEFYTDELTITCPNCHKSLKGEEVKLPPIPMPFSASSYTQKLFNIIGKYAVSSFGQGIINGKSIYFHLREFERSINESGESGTYTMILDKLINYFEQELLNELPKYKEEAPDKWYPIGFHFNGYKTDENGTKGYTTEVYIGKENIVREEEIIGCTIGGDIKVVKKLWEIGREDEHSQIKYHLLSLQDAVELSEYLIETTSNFQRFANEVPTVGGAIDISLVTPFEGFQWIKRKELMETIEEQKTKRFIKEIGEKAYYDFKK